MESAALDRIKSFGADQLIYLGDMLKKFNKSSDNISNVFNEFSIANIGLYARGQLSEKPF
jgi:hypothetical protein